MARFLCVERPFQDEEIFEWNQNILDRFHIDDSNVQAMEEGHIVWIDDVAFSMGEE